MKQSIFIFRHGETDWNREQRFQGHLDIPLNEKGREQARGLTPLLKDHAIEAILSSDLGRAVETAEIIAKALDIPVFKDERLREAHLGLAQGLTIDEIEKKFGNALFQRWKSPLLSDADISYPQGESGTQIYQRAQAAILHFLQTHHYKKIGVASHGGVIRRFMQNLLPPGSPTAPIPNAGVYQILFDPRSKKMTIK